MEYPYPRLNQIKSLRCTKNARNTTKRVLSDESGKINEMMNKIATIPRPQSIQVRTCMPGFQIIDFQFDKSTSKIIEIISQYNNNFIVTIIKNENKKMLVLMDQHAIDERIRYEQLLEEYTALNHTIVVSMDVQRPIIMNDFPKNICLSLAEHSKDIQRYGIKLELDKSDCLVVTSIPKCFNKTKFWRNQSELKFLIKKLLLDMTDKSNGTYTPNGTVLKTIHHVIASEACHGAIKFGQKLSQAQCKKLVKSLMDTKAPSRCAHGRPSIIPLIQLMDVYSDNRRARGRLNFASLHRDHNFRDHTRSEG